MQVLDDEDQRLAGPRRADQPAERPAQLPLARLGLILGTGRAGSGTPSKSKEGGTGPRSARVPAVATERGERTADRIGERTPRRAGLRGAAIDRYRELIERTAERGIPPERVAKAIEHPLSAKRPRARCRVGLDAKLAARLVKVVPLSDRIIARQMGLQRSFTSRGRSYTGEAPIDSSINEACPPCA